MRKLQLCIKRAVVFKQDGIAFENPDAINAKSAVSAETATEAATVTE